MLELLVVIVEEAKFDGNFSFVKIFAWLSTFSISNNLNARSVNVTGTTSLCFIILLQNFWQINSLFCSNHPVSISSLI